jgi:hypothetical protein
MTQYMVDPNRGWAHNQNSASRTKNWLSRTRELDELYSPEHPPSMLSGFVPDNDDTYSTHSLPPKMTIRYKDGRQPQYISYEHHKRSDSRSRSAAAPAAPHPRPSHARSSSDRELRQDRTRSRSLGNTAAVPMGSSQEGTIRSRSQGNTSLAVNASSRSQNSHHSRAPSTGPQPQVAPQPVPVSSYPTYNHSDVPEDIKILPTNSPEPLPIPPPLPRSTANQSSNRGGPPRPLPPRLYPQPPESTSSWVYLPSNYAPSAHTGAGPIQQSQSQPIPSKHNFPRHAPRVVAQQQPHPSSSSSHAPAPAPAVVVTAPSSHTSSAPGAAARPRSRSSGSKPAAQSVIYTSSMIGPGPIVVQLNHNGPPSVRYTQSAPVPGQKSSMPSLVPASASIPVAAKQAVNLGNGTRYVERAGDAQFASVRGSMLGTVNEERDYERRDKDSRDRRSMHSRGRSVPRPGPGAVQPQQPTIAEHPEHSRPSSHSAGTVRDSNGSYVVVANKDNKDNKPVIKVHVVNGFFLYIINSWGSKSLTRSKLNSLARVLDHRRRHHKVVLHIRHRLLLPPLRPPASRFSSGFSPSNQMVPLLPKRGL